jgi:hypothetical protein
MPKLLFVIFIFFSQVLNSQIRIYSNDFLTIGVGARALSMSNSVLSNSEGAQAAIWNPASSVFMNQNIEVSAMHSEYFAGIAKFDYIGAVYKTTDSSTIGAAIVRFGIDDIPNTLELIDENGNVDYDRIKLFSVSDYAFLFSFGKKSKIKGLSLGSSAKLIYRNQAEFAKAFGFGFDLSCLYKKGKWSYGANFKDITTTFNAWFYNQDSFKTIFLETENEIPENSVEITAPKLLLGISRNSKLNDNFSIISEIGTDISFDGQKHVLISSKLINIDPHIGIEVNYKNLIFVRAGSGNYAIIKDFDKNMLNVQPSIGIGINYKNFKIDYALTDIGDQSIALYSNIFSMSYAFNKLKRK